MSYYFGIALKDSLLFGCDRTFNNKITGENRADSKRYSILGNNRIFLPTGNMNFCMMARDLMHDIFGSSLEAFGSGNSAFSEMASMVYQKVKEDSLGQLQNTGKNGDTENVDCLYGGFNHDGVPFIISVSSADDFQLKLINKPMQYVCLNQSPKVLTFVKGLLKNFIGATEGLGIDEVWTLGKRFLPSIIQKISKMDNLVSESGDLIFVSKEGIQEFEFGKKEIPMPEAEFTI